jgi:hypothetical protein
VTLSEPSQLEALTIALLIAPGVYPRNRMFERMSTPHAQRARTRASLLRGLLPQLARAATVTLTREPMNDVTLRFAIPAIRFTRVVQLTMVELAALRIAAERARLRILPVSSEDRELVARSLSRLMDGAAVREHIAFSPGAT